MPLQIPARAPSVSTLRFASPLAVQRGRPSLHRCFTASPPASVSTFPQSPKKQVTVTSSDPSTKQWAELSKGQKVGRTASTGVSFLTIVAGLAVTGGVFYFIYMEILAPDSATSWFNTSVNKVKNDAQCRRLLGDGKIKAYGEPTSNRWARNRPLASSTRTDRNGTEHLLMHFNVEGDLDRGVVNLHVTRKPGQDYEYQYLYLDVPGKQRVYLEKIADTRSEEGGSKGFMGVKWRW